LHLTERGLERQFGARTPGPRLHTGAGTPRGVSGVAGGRTPDAINCLRLSIAGSSAVATYFTRLRVERMPRRCVADVRTEHSSPHCREIDADDPVPPGSSLLRRRPEAVKAMRNPYVRETRLFERRNQLCFQQSTGDSTGPQIDIPPRLLWQLDAEHNVRDLHSTT
jgi:hypothetical protein